MRTPSIFVLVLTASVAAALAGCTDRPLAPPPATTTTSASGAARTLDQGDYCFVLNYPMGMSALKTCKPGERVVFMPQQWGNEQLPVQFVSMACDLRYTVAMTNGGVVCIYYRKPKAAGKPSTAASTARASS